jgi:hypothetical protein
LLTYIVPAIAAGAVMIALVWHERRRLRKKRSGGYPYSRHKHK